MNLYRGCAHNCVYCDGRSEGYYVDGIFGRDISVKVNAIELLKRELDPGRKRVPFKKAYFGVGGGVGDSYQGAEKKYKLTRQTLEILEEYAFPVHILTKSILIERDMDILVRLNKKSAVIVNFSFSSTDEDITKIFEPGAGSPEDKIESIKKFKDNGFACGVYMMPVIPFITDTQQIMGKTIRDLKNAGVDFIIFGGMTLKKGRQKEYFYNILNKHYPNLISLYNNIYQDRKWGQATDDYYNSINKSFYEIVKEYKIPIRIPPNLFNSMLDENDLVSILLEHLDYYLKFIGKKSPYGYSAYTISNLKKPLSSIRETLLDLKGVGKVTERIIKEIIDTGKSSYYDKVRNYEL
jgi:DNA repair photolyase